MNQGMDEMQQFRRRYEQSSEYSTQQNMLALPDLKFKLTEAKKLIDNLDKNVYPDAL